MAERKISWVPIAGQWELTGNRVQYLGPSEPTAPLGIILCDRAFKDGSAEVSVNFTAWDADSAARILLGYEARTREYVSIGIGGYGRAFVLSRFRSGVGWRGEAVEGDWSNLKPNKVYAMRVSVTGQTIALSVDGVKVIDHRLDQPLPGSQVGLFAWGKNQVEYSDFAVGKPSRPRGFIVMEFSEPYDALYREVLLPVAEKEGLDLRRADEIKGPGIILQDIVNDIAESTLIIAEITPPNPNVFYELGYAHALNKPTILLVRREEKLPFDIAGYRCIFYDDTIAGKSSVEKEFRQHLRAILGKS